MSYPILHKLESDGEVRTETEIVNNRTRVYYILTKTGHESTREKVNELQEFIQTLTILISHGPSLEVCKS
ncbi:MAG: PadR family transcriptional regulator [Bacteroidales bacterium]|nr:PadR family transcriptional regulator [Bacteroidales bacterium]